jgi:ribose/xylose/arabinose/galactoside ABC-type transport system permease subunit
MTSIALNRSFLKTLHLHRRISDFGLLFLVAAIAVVTGLIEPRFWSLANLQNLARQLAPLQILVAGQVFAVLCGGIDLSIASVLALSGVVGVTAIPHIGLEGGLAVMVLTGLAFGLLNGTIIVSFSVSPLIVTLGMLSVAKGLALLSTGGLPIYEVPEALVDTIGFGAVYGVPVSSLLAFSIMIVGAIILRKTVFGRHVYAVGSNPVAARNSGVRVSRVLLGVYAITGLTAGIGAVVMTAWVSAAQPLAGEGLELHSLAAVVVGGVALAGGSGTMLQGFLGMLVLGLLSNALNMAGVSSFLQTLVVGLVILLAVIVDRWRAGRKTGS